MLLYNIFLYFCYIFCPGIVHFVSFPYAGLCYTESDSIAAPARCGDGKGVCPWPPPPRKRSDLFLYPPANRAGEPARPATSCPRKSSCAASSASAGSPPRTPQPAGEPRRYLPGAGKRILCRAERRPSRLHPSPYHEQPGPGGRHMEIIEGASDYLAGVDCHAAVYPIYQDAEKERKTFESLLRRETAPFSFCRAIKRKVGTCISTSSAAGSILCFWTPCRRGSPETSYPATTRRAAASSPST